MKKIKIGDKVRVVKLFSGDEECYKLGDVFVVSSISTFNSPNENGEALWSLEKSRGIFEIQVELVEEEAEVDKNYTFKEMLLELMKDSEKEFVNTHTRIRYRVKDKKLVCGDKHSRLAIHSLFDSTMDTEAYIEVNKLFSDRIKKGDMYYYIDTDDSSKYVLSSNFDDDYIDKRRMDMHNFFETREEALKKLNLILEVLKNEN